eukprot:6190961-Pleurochrysis_carterae.AAC.1
MPVLATLLVVLVTAAMMRKLQKPSFIAWLVNTFIGGVEYKIKLPPNAQLRKVEEDVVKPAASALKTNADAFFPKFENVIDTVRSALELVKGKSLPEVKSA